MNELSLKEFLSPFTDMATYLKAVEIVERLFSELKQNYQQIAEVIATEVSVKANLNELKKFAERIRLFPGLYGVDFFKSSSYSKKNDSLSDKMHTNVLTPDILECIFCESIKLVNKPLRFAKNPILYAQNKIDYCLFDTKYCPSCQKYHFISYAYNDKNKKKHFYRDAHKSKYFQYTNETIFETDVFKNLIAAILFNHASFRGFTQAYNYRYANTDFSRVKLNAKRLTDVFYAYELNRYYSEFKSETLTSKYYFLNSDY
jgi:hypothetical protein